MTRLLLILLLLTGIPGTFILWPLKSNELMYHAYQHAKTPMHPNDRIPTNDSEHTLRDTSQQILQAELDSAMERFRLALLNPNEEQLLHLTNPGLTYGHSSGMIEDQANFIHSLISGKFRFTALNFSDVDCRIYGSTAIVRHALRAVSADRDKPPGKVHLHVVLVWQKQQGQLQLLLRQAVKI